METEVVLRAATPADIALLRRWDEQPHVVASDPHDDWDWEVSLHEQPDWREQLIAEVDACHRVRADHRPGVRGDALLG